MVHTGQRAPQQQSSGRSTQFQLALWSSTIAFVVFLAIKAMAIVAPAHFPRQTEWLDAAIVLSATLATLLNIGRRLPAQNVILAAVIIGVMGGFAQALAVRTAIPFGPITFAATPEWRLLRVPWWAPLIWIVAILNSRGVARLMLRPWRKMRTYGFWLLGVTAILSALWDFCLEPFATRLGGYWLWGPTNIPITWYGVPISNFVAWPVVAALILAFVTPSLIDKNPAPRPPANYHPLAVWILSNGLFALGAFSLHLTVAGAVNLAIMCVVASFAVRGARW